METDLPVPIDDSLPFVPQQHEEIEQEQQPRFYREPEPVYYYRQPTPQPQPKFEQTQKTRDIFSELGKTHWIIFISAVLLAFFMGKSISTPIIIRSN
jgi:hypothetical protein